MPDENSPADGEETTTDETTDETTTESTDGSADGTTEQVDNSQISLGAVETDESLASNDAGTLSDSTAMAQFDTNWPSEEGVA